jgi:hypothetical protein
LFYPEDGRVPKDILFLDILKFNAVVLLAFDALGRAKTTATPDRNYEFKKIKITEFSSICLHNLKFVERRRSISF